MIRKSKYSSYTKNITVRVEKKIAEEFDAITRKMAINKTLLFQNWIKAYIERNKNKEDDPAYLQD